MPNMLGVRREGVTEAWQATEGQYHQVTTAPKISGMDQTALESRSCECYRVVHREPIGYSRGARVRTTLLSRYSPPR